MKIERIVMQWSMGALFPMLEEAKETAIEHECIVQFPFNGVTVEVTKHADLENGCESVLNAIGTKGAVVRVGD